RAMGRNATGVRGMRLPVGAYVVSMLATSELAENAALLADSELAEGEEAVEVVETPDVEENDSEEVVLKAGQAQVLIACANGYGKRTPVSKFTLRKRGGQGVVAIQTSERNGELVAAVQAGEGKDLLLISDMGTLVRTRIDEVSVMSRSAQGVTLIRLSNDEQLVAVVSLDAPEEEVIEADNTEEVVVATETVVASTDEQAEAV
ncbi:MAG TPA: DNA gyrase C-terminal beta-propeller domain-containing protein, partial [Agitococcus sp.]|nr:DNA gyrase C-terminal beta-propeller domain-containing protein [Agitococcus sp.]